MNKKRVIIILVSILILVPFIAVFSIGLFTSLFASNTVAIITALQTRSESQIEELPDKESTIEEDGDNTAVEIGETTDSLYNMATHIDISKINDTATPSLQGRYFMLPGWTIKNYIMMYRLVGEICLREEINPPTAAVKITPQILLGKMYCESGMFTGSFNGHDFPGLNNSVLAWELDNAVNTLLTNPTDFIALGPCGQSQYYQFQHDNAGLDSDWESITDSSKVCLYICKEENPSLADDERAVYGTYYSFRDGKGAYITKDFWEGRYLIPSMQKLTESIKQGSLAGRESTQQIRPAVFYLPDALYTVAFDMRTFLNGKYIGNPLGEQSGAASDIVDNYEALFDTIPIDNKIWQDALLTLSLSPQLFPEPTMYLPNTNSNIGRLWYYMVCDSVPFTYVPDNLIDIGSSATVARNAVLQYVNELSKTRSEFYKGNDFLNVADAEAGYSEWYAPIGAFVCGNELYHTFEEVIKQAYNAYPAHISIVGGTTGSDVDSSNISQGHGNRERVLSYVYFSGYVPVFVQPQNKWFSSEELFDMFPDSSYFTYSGRAGTSLAEELQYGSGDFLGQGVECYGFAELVSHNLLQKTTLDLTEYGYGLSLAANWTGGVEFKKVFQELPSGAHIRVADYSLAYPYHSFCILKDPTNLDSVFVYQCNYTYGVGDRNVVHITEYTYDELLTWLSNGYNMIYAIHY